LNLSKGKNKKYCYGYKVHIGVDQGSGIARKTQIINARGNDHELFDNSSVKINRVYMLIRPIKLKRGRLISSISVV
jgi:hypothetical protein